VPGKLTHASAVAKFTVAVTPSSQLSFFPIRAAHHAQVIPPIESPTLHMADCRAASVTDDRAQRIVAPFLRARRGI
jgi:hypothetical protein